jgi:hypothetical protein
VNDNTVSMVPIKRRFVAVLSACVIAANVLAYIYSFFDAPVDTILPWMVPLILGSMVLLVPIIVDKPVSRSLSFPWKLGSIGMPSWAAPGFWIVQLFAIGNLVWFAIHSGWGVPAIIDGQYVSDARGRILKVLTQAEYFRLKEAELRTITAFMISFYFPPMMYWWYRRT